MSIKKETIFWTIVVIVLWIKIVDLAGAAL